MAKSRRWLSGLVPGIAGATLGATMVMMQVSEIAPVNSSVDLLAYQDFALYMGLGVGFLFGFIAFAAFLALAKRFQYPASSGMGARLGAVTSALLCFATNLILYISAPAFDYVRSPARGFIFVSVFTAVLGGVVGLIVGYFMSEIGGRNLHHR
jgi:uncharacterized membrane protein